MDILSGMILMFHGSLEMIIDLNFKSLGLNTFGREHNFIINLLRYIIFKFCIENEFVCIGVTAKNRRR